MFLRPIALFLGCFSLLNLSAELLVPGFDANIWWVDFRLLPPPLPTLALAWIGLSLIAYAVVSVPAVRWWRWPPAAGLALLTAFVTHNAVSFYSLLFGGEIAAGFPIPLSLFILVPTVLIASKIWLAIWRDRRGSKPPADSRGHSPPGSPWRRRVAWLATLATLAVAFPVAQMFCFGCTDYRRPADAVVVFGARAYASGQMSTSLYDRTRTAVELYRAGLAGVLVFSGGPGDGDIHETEAMRRYAVENGVPDSAILLDEHGLSTQATVDNTVELFAQRGYTRVLAVSQFFHLPRIKMTYLRADREVLTVPAKKSTFIPGTPYFMLREVAALWFYYLRPLVPGA